MYNVFNKVLQSDMGKTLVRKHASTLDAKSVWGEFEYHMSTSSKGLNARHRLHPMSLHLSMIGPGRKPLNNFFYISMKSSGN